MAKDSGSKALETAQTEANRIAEEQLKIAQRQSAISEERYKYWKENYYPIEQEMVQRAKVGEDVGYAAERARRNVQQGFQSQEGMSRRELERLGIDASNPRYKDLLSNFDLYKQAALTGAQNIAREQTTERNRQLKMQVAGMGQGLAPQAISSMSGAAQGYAGAAASGMQGAQGLVSAINTGAANKLSAAQFNAQMAAEQGRLAYGKQKLQTDTNLYDMGQRMNQRLLDWSNQSQIYSAVGGIAGLAAGAGLGYAMSPGMSNAQIGASAIGTSTGKTGGFSGGVPSSSWGSGGYMPNKYWMLANAAGGGNSGMSNVCLGYLIGGG